MITTVQDLIDALNKIEDKSSLVIVDGHPIDDIYVSPITHKVFIFPNDYE